MRFDENGGKTSVGVENSGINDAIFHSFLVFVILSWVHVASTNQKRDHLLEVFGAIRHGFPYESPSLRVQRYDRAVKEEDLSRITVKHCYALSVQ